MENVTFGNCPVCRQGELVAVKSPSTGEMLLMCDDCESQWKSPEAAQSYENALTKEVPAVRKASIAEIDAAGWKSMT